jgi:hypothetical protein
LELAREGKFNLTVSSAILDEMGGMLARKFNWPLLRKSPVRGGGLPQ